MTETVTPSQRAEFRNINAFKDLPTYRLPPAGWVSILHRISGALMFVLMPFVIWLFDVSVSSEISFARFTAVFDSGMLGLPGVAWKLLALVLIWAFLHHLIAGLRVWSIIGRRHAGPWLGLDAGAGTQIIRPVLKEEQAWQ